MGTVARQKRNRKNETNEKTSVRSSADKQEDAADRVCAALTANPGSTVVDIAAFACVAKSTAARLLVDLERSGDARRTRHEGRHQPDTWHPTGTGTETELSDSGADTDPETDQTDPETPTPEADEADVSALDIPDTPEDAEPAAPERPNLADDAPNEAAESVAAPDLAILPNGQPKLRSGALRDMVAEHLAAHPDIAFTPTELSHKLDNRSSGAIANALDKLTASGHATQVQDRPRRFQATTGTGGPDADAA